MLQGGTMLAPCGLNCETCDIHLASTNQEIQKKLVENFKKAGHQDAKPEWFHCKGCPGDRKDHWSPDCEILICCVDKKKLKNCSQCPEFICEKIKKWGERMEHHQQAIENLKTFQKVN